MASSYDVNDITVFYKIMPTAGVYTETRATEKQNIISATIIDGKPTLDDYFPSDDTHDYYVYQGKYIIGGITYDKWYSNNNTADAYYFTNVIVNNSGTEFLDPDQVALPLVAIYNPTISTVLPKDIDGYVELPCPSAYTGSSSTLVSSARNSAGVVIGDVVREDVSKVELTWNFLTIEQFSAIAQLFSTTYGGNFFAKVRYYDSVANDWLVKIMYPNDRAFETAQITLDKYTGKPIGYTGFSLHLIDTCKAVE